MALNGSDLFVVQATDGILYKVRLDALIAEVEGGDGVVFRGAVDLNNPPVNSGVTLPGQNGDFYIVESNAAAIDNGWVMVNGETSATQGDRVIYDAANTGWLLITSGSANAGTVTEVQAAAPLDSDGDAVSPVISSREARTPTAATNAGDGNGTAGHVARLAEAADVAHDGAGATDAVVTADLLKATNKTLHDLTLAPGGVQTVTYANTDSNNAIVIPDTSGAVTLDIKNATDTVWGVVNIADATDITNGVSGAGAVVDASQLKEVADAIPEDVVASLTEGGTDIVAGALEIAADGDDNVTIGVKNNKFCPFDFSNLPDISTAPAP